jgi:hypothetical protein
MNARFGLKSFEASRHLESVAHRIVWKTIAMSAAQVANATMSSSISRVALARGNASSSRDPIDAVDTDFAARGRDTYARSDELDDFESPRQRRRRGEFQEEVVRFSGVLLSREVGTAMMQAQAMTSRLGPGAVSVQDAERHVSLYEFNQALMGVPEVTTQTGIMH